MPFDPRPWIERLASGTENDLVWHEFWEELHHQGDVGEASYATVPYLVRIYRQLGIFDGNPYAIVACIDLCRTERNNPPVPEWLKDEYFPAIHELADYGLSQWKQAQTPEDVRGILGVLALSKDLRVHAKFLFNYSDNELLELECKA